MVEPLAFFGKEEKKLSIGEGVEGGSWTILDLGDPGWNS
jgi:hypothetical protein